MEIFKRDNVIGEAITMRATNEKHFGFIDQPQAPGALPDGNSTFISDFGKMLNNQLGKVNELQLDSDELTTKMAITPDEVNIHDVMIAAEKAQLALNMTKQVRDKLVNAYQTLLNMR